MRMDTDKIADVFWLSAIVGAVSIIIGTTLIFVAAKVFGFVEWSWGVVFFPAWASFLMPFVLIPVLMLLMAIAKLLISYIIEIKDW